MQAKGLVAAALIALLAAPVIARAEGTVRGAQEGAEEGGERLDHWEQSSEERWVWQRARSAAFLASMIVLASANMSFVSGGLRIATPRNPSWYNTTGKRRDDYEFPAEYHAPNYRYTYVNERPVLVDPRTRRIVEIID